MGGRSLLPVPRGISREEGGGREMGVEVLLSTEKGRVPRGEWVLTCFNELKFPGPI